MTCIQKIRTLVFAAAAVALTQVADARPFAIDQHGAICQAQQPNSVRYDNGGVTSTIAGAVVVCPLSAVAMLNDATPHVKVQVKMYTTGSMSCTFESASESGASGSQLKNFTPTAGTYTSADIGPVDQPVYPHDGTMPVRVSLICTLATSGSSIASIQIETLNVTTAGPVAMTGGPT
jgi:hypothetical protein